jgi:hypothetical protein
LRAKSRGRASSRSATSTSKSSRWPGTTSISMHDSSLGSEAVAPASPSSSLGSPFGSPSQNTSDRAGLPSRARSTRGRTSSVLSASSSAQLQPMTNTGGHRPAAPRSAAMIRPAHSLLPSAASLGSQHSTGMVNLSPLVYSQGADTGVTATNSAAVGPFQLPSSNAPLIYAFTEDSRGYGNAPNPSFDAWSQMGTSFDEAVLAPPSPSSQSSPSPSPSIWRNQEHTFALAGSPLPGNRTYPGNGPSGGYDTSVSPIRMLNLGLPGAAGPASSISVAGSLVLGEGSITLTAESSLSRSTSPAPTQYSGMHTQQLQPFTPGASGYAHSVSSSPSKLTQPLLAVGSSRNQLRPVSGRLDPALVPQPYVASQGGSGNWQREINAWSAMNGDAGSAAMYSDVHVHATPTVIAPRVAHSAFSPPAIFQPQQHPFWNGQNSNMPTLNPAIVGTAGVGALAMAAPPSPDRERDRLWEWERDLERVPVTQRRRSARPTALAQITQTNAPLSSGVRYGSLESPSAYAPDDAFEVFGYGAASGGVAGAIVPGDGDALPSRSTVIAPASIAGGGAPFQFAPPPQMQRPATGTFVSYGVPSSSQGNARR